MTRGILFFYPQLINTAEGPESTLRRLDPARAAAIRVHSCFISGFSQFPTRNGNAVSASVAARVDFFLVSSYREEEPHTSISHAGNL